MSGAVYLNATGLVLPSPNTRDSVMSMLSERIMGTMCLNREEGDGVPTICCQTDTHTPKEAMSSLKCKSKSSDNQMGPTKPAYKNHHLCLHFWPLNHNCSRCPVWTPASQAGSSGRSHGWRMRNTWRLRTRSCCSTESGSSSKGQCRSHCCSDCSPSWHWWGY